MRRTRQSFLEHLVHGVVGQIVKRKVADGLILELHQGPPLTRGRAAASLGRRPPRSSDVRIASASVVAPRASRHDAALARREDCGARALTREDFEYLLTADDFDEEEDTAD